MKAFVLAAGKGTRLRPLTDNTPKALVPYPYPNGKPMIAYAVDKLRQSRCVTEIVINAWYLAHQIRHYAGTLRPGKPVWVSDEHDFPDALETGGGIKYACGLLHDGLPFLVHNCDIISNLDVDEFCNHAVRAMASDPLLLACLVATKRETGSRRYLVFEEVSDSEAEVPGGVGKKKKQRLTGWTNLKTGEVKGRYPTDALLLGFNGIYILSPRVFDLMASWPQRFSIVDFLLAHCHHWHIDAYTPDGLILRDLGKIEDIMPPV